MASILDEFKNKYPNSEEMGKANNIAEAVAAMPEGGGGGAGDSDLFVLHCDNTSYMGTIAETGEEFRAAFAAHKAIALDYLDYDGLVMRYHLVNVVDKETETMPASGTPVEGLKFIFQKFVATSYNTSGMIPKAEKLDVSVINIICPLEGPIVSDGPYNYNIITS